MRVFFRLLSLIALVVAVIAGVIDAIQSVAASAVVLTPLGIAFADVSPNTLRSLRTFVDDRLPGMVGDPGLTWLLAQPAFAVFLALALLLYVIGYRRKRRAGRFTAR